MISPTYLKSNGMKPNRVVQKEGEFIITFPAAYHSGFNLGYNCAESTNFALERWIEAGKMAKVCYCINSKMSKFFTVNLNFES